jgi:glycosyltransferase involved in cell wall biosynthesis
MRQSTAQSFLVIDVQGIQNPHHPERGIARYVRELSRSLLQHADEELECFVANPQLGLVDGLEPLIATGRLSWSHPEGPSGRALEKPFLYWATSPFEVGTSIDDVWPAYARRADVLTAVTVFDLIPLIYSDHYLADPVLREWYKARLGLVQTADLVFTISDATAEDVVGMLDVPEERVVTIGTGVSELWHPPSDQEDPEGLVRSSFPEIRPGYLFYTGGIDFRKNMERLLEAYADLESSLRRRHQLVITCSMDPAGEQSLRTLIGDLGVDDDVVLTGFVPDETLLALYQASHLFVFPSLYEGFGLPLVEAIRSGVPAITADRASMREIVPDESLRFDPTDTGAITESIRWALTETDLRDRARGIQSKAVEAYTWDTVADRALDALRRVWASRTRVSDAPSNGWKGIHPVRPRVAWFSPMPPQRSGIADYSVQLLGALAQHLDIDVFVEGRPSEFDHLSSDRVTLRPYRAFPLLDTVDPYDEVVYCMGNSEFHSYVYDALLARPGVVLAHEVRFNGFYAWYGQNRSQDPNFFQRALAAQHPNVPPGAGADGSITPDEADRFGIYMVSELLDRSTKFLVHSEYAANIARLQSPRSARRVAVVPFGIATPAEGAAATNPSQPLIVTMGIAAKVKATDTFVEAIPLVLDSVPDARFAIVGSVDDSLREELLERADSLGVADYLTITGHVDRAEYESWLARASIAVQLRRTSNGETSAAVVDCLRYAVPTVVSEIGSAREYPVGSVYLIPVDATGRELAQGLVRLTTDSELARSLTARGLEYSRSSSFDTAARSLLQMLGLGVGSFMRAS